MKDITWMSNFSDATGWKNRHRAGIRESLAGRGCPVLPGIHAWCEYAQFHRKNYGSPIGEDNLLGLAWAEWGYALLDLLNGDLGGLGGLDAGTLDAIIRDNLAEQGFNADRR